MKTCIVLALMLVAASYAVDITDAQTSEAKPTPTYPPKCCEQRSGCDAATLSKYCAPCPPSPCDKFNECPCYFPGTKEVIKPRENVEYTPRAPFCDQCPQYRCMIVDCDEPMKECTYADIQRFID